MVELSHALTGIRVVTMAPNVPGPVAAARLRDLGATVLKIEPPAGDFLAASAPRWYADLHRDMTIEKLDLKTPAGREALDAHLGAADIFLTSSRPSALERLGLGWDALHARHPHLIHVAIVGEFPPNEEHAGHDLTYVAQLGLVDPPTMPRTLIADLAGAERAVSATIGLLFARARASKGAGILASAGASAGASESAGGYASDGVGGHAYVSLRDAAETFALPLEHGLTAPGGNLSGAFPGYRCYATTDGWIAIAALEPHFWKRMRDLLGNGAADADFAAAFAEHDGTHWTSWAVEHDMPLIAFG
jgi:crotonobetainyl-CoA:carnitine CoA-transferase CaiB-like acyl-CoA transferase